MLQDIRQILKNIAKAPIFFGALVLTLAIGIGANTAIFSLVKTVLLQPLPYPDADGIVGISKYPWVPVELYDDLRASGGNTFEEVAAFYPQSFAVTGGDHPIEVEGARVTPNFFRIFRAGAAQGRGFSPADGAAGPVVVSEGFWRHRQDGTGDPAHRTLTLDGVSHPVIGMIDPAFRQITPGNGHPRLWLASTFEPLRPDGSMGYVIPLARLRKGAPLHQAQAAFSVVIGRFLERHPELRNNSRWNQLRLVPIREELTGDIRPALLMLQAAVGILLLIACVNVANLLHARFLARQRELAIRAALGATKGRLVRQLLTESLVLALLGGLAGFLLMRVCLKAILGIAPVDIPRIQDVSGDPAVFLFALGLSVLTGLAFGVFPSALGTRRTLHDQLKEGGRSPGRSRGQSRASQALVVAEVALSMVLLAGAGLLIQSFFSLTSQSLGFRTKDVLAIAVSSPGNRHASVPDLEAFYRLARERLRQVPGVESACVSNNLPIKRGRSSRTLVIEGLPEPRTMQYGVVSPGFFGTLGIPIRQGRDFEDSDRRTSPPVAVVDEAMATALWPQQNPIGKRFRMPDASGWISVVGVVGDIRGNGLAREPGPGFYISNQQRPDTLVELTVGRQAVFLIHSRLGPAAMAPALRRAIWDADPQQPVPEITTLDQVLDREGASHRFRALLLGLFAAIAMLLVAAGIYGIVEYLVSERTHELGVRKALGATDGSLIRGILAWGLKLAAIGTALGVLAVFALGRFLASLLFGVGALDPGTLMASGILIGLITVVACFIPARRVARVDPMTALRSE